MLLEKVIGETDETGADVRRHNLGKFADRAGRKVQALLRDPGKQVGVFRRTGVMHDELDRTPGDAAVQQIDQRSEAATTTVSAADEPDLALPELDQRPDAQQGRSPGGNPGNAAAEREIVQAFEEHDEADARNSRFGGGGDIGEASSGCRGAGSGADDEAFGHGGVLRVNYDNLDAFLACDFGALHGVRMRRAEPAGDGDADYGLAS